jgi:hypothetical protein
VSVSDAVKRRPRLVRYLAIAAIFCFAILAADSYSYRIVGVTGDAMDWVSHFLAGFGGVNCGRVGSRSDPSRATQCALEANASGRPFRVIYNLWAIDSSTAVGLVRTGHGRIFALGFSGCSTGCYFSLLAQRVQVKPCPQPYHLYLNRKGHISCVEQVSDSDGGMPKGEQF